MTISFHAPEPWKRLKTLARKSRGIVAVPYLGKNAATLLPLKRGSLLVTRVNEKAVRQAQVDPSEIAKLIRRGVVVHNCSNLHAKVFVFGTRAVVGSANISNNSAKLVEACVEVSDRSTVATTKAFVEGLCLDKIGPEFAKSLIPLYPGERTWGGGGERKKSPGSAEHSRLWVWPVFEEEWSAEAQEANESGRKTAQREITDKKNGRLVALDGEGSFFLVNKLQAGDRLIQRWSEGNGYSFDAPARVVHLKTYSGGTLVYLEEQKRLRRVVSRKLRQTLGTDARGLVYKGNGLRLVRNRAVVAKTVSLWPKLKAF